MSARAGRRARARGAGRVRRARPGVHGRAMATPSQLWGGRGRAEPPNSAPSRFARCRPSHVVPARRCQPVPLVDSRRDDPARPARRGAGRRADHRPGVDNRVVEPGFLFFCVPGFTRDGHDFAPDAVARGAAALVVARPLGLGVPEVRSRTSARRWRSPRRASTAIRRRALPVAGITGTNGKTTTAFLVRSLLEAAGRRCGLLGTVKSVIGGVERAGRAHDAGGDRPPAHVRRDARGRRRACAMEISSHALELRRADGSTSPPPCSPTSRRTTSTSPRTWRPTSRPSGCCSPRR